jgi:predicted GNAT superfamily acetyltransferase
VTDDVTLRRLETHAESEACVRLQEATWGEGFRERVPTSVLHVAHEIGGVVAGAFDRAGELVAFVFGLTGVRGGRLVHWSDMLAVRPGLRDRGLGVRLKELQRELVRPLGVEAILWTYDPLVARNAHLNLVKLGARVERYVEDMYGSDTGSKLHGAMGTDRFIVEWPVAPDRNRRESEVARSARDDGVHVEIPPDIYALLATDPAAAAEWRRETRAAFRARLDAGWTVAGFVGGRDVARPHYLLTPPERRATS